MEALLEQWGLAAVFLGVFVEGDVVMLLAGVVAHLGFTDLPAAVMAGALGGFASDFAWFAVGRWQSDRVRNMRIYRRAEPVIMKLADRMGPWQVMLCRFVYGTRVPTIILWAVRRLPLPRFLALDLAGCVLWASAFGCVGYLLSGSAALIVGEVKRAEHWLLGAVAVAIVVVLGLKALAGWQRRRASP